MRALLLAILVILSVNFWAQDDIYKAIDIPAVDIFASDSEWTHDSLISRIINDTTFYKSFLNMKYYPHDIEGFIKVYHKNASEKGRMLRNAVQHLEEGVKWVEIQSEESNGKIRKKNGKFKYLTAEMYDEVFYPEYKHRVTNNIKSLEQLEDKGSKIDKYKSQLKKMLFNPGAPIESVPFIGDKMAIFSNEMVPYYEFNIFTAYLQDSTDCLVFTCEAKPGIKSSKTVIKSMVTYFDKDNFNVLNRAYRLQYSNLIFQFDISMKIENKVIDGILVPEKISYSGWWDIPAKKPEIIDFYLKCSNYKFDT